MDSLITQMQNTEAALYHNKDFIDFIEMNMADLRKASINNGSVMELSETQRARGDRNFNLICNMAGVPFHLHWLTLRINGYKSYTEYRTTTNDLYLVDTEKLASLKLKFIDYQNIT